MQARIVTDLKNGPFYFVQVQDFVTHGVGAAHHCAQLEHAKTFAVFPDALLRVKWRAAIHQHDRNRRDRNDRKSQKHEQGAENDIGRAFGGPPPLGNDAAATSLDKLGVLRQSQDDIARSRDFVAYHLQSARSNEAATVFPTRSNPSTTPMFVPASDPR